MAVYVVAYCGPDDPYTPCNPSQQKCGRQLDFTVPVSTLFKVGSSAYGGQHRISQIEGSFSFMWLCLIDACFSYSRVYRSEQITYAHDDHVEIELIRFLNKHMEVKRQPYGGDFYFGEPRIAVDFLMRHRLYDGMLS